MAELVTGSFNKGGLTAELIVDEKNRPLTSYTTAELNTSEKTSELVTGDKSKGIKSVGELALRISKFDSYRLFTLYEDVKSRKLMDVSGGQKYYLVFKSPKKEIRIPEYDPHGFFQVDKENGCILFKITKKNAEDILSMRTAGEKIFHIIRVFEERDIYGRIVSVTDEVEVYNGKWGDDNEFSAFSTANKVDLLTKALAAQIDKNATLLKEYNDLLEKYNLEIKKGSDLEKDMEELRAERDSLQSQLSKYLGNTYDGTLLSTDTKYIAFENTMQNISFTEEQLSDAISEMMKGDYEYDNGLNEPMLNLDVEVDNNIKDNITIKVRKNGSQIGTSTNNQKLSTTPIDIAHGDYLEFVHKTSGYRIILDYAYENWGFGGAVKINHPSPNVAIANIDFMVEDSDIYDVGGSIGTLKCRIEKIPNESETV